MNDKKILHIKNQWKVMSDFRKIKLHFPPPLFVSGGKTGITFFLLVRYCRKKFWWDKSIHFVCFPKKNDFVCFPRFLAHFCPKFSLFLQKIAYFGGKQTNSILFFKNIEFGSWRCLWTPQVLQNHQKSWLYVFPKLDHGHAKFRKMKNLAIFSLF